jgi:hypothetical protein
MYLGEYRPEQLFRNSDLGTLESSHPGVGNNLGSNLYELQLDTGERPMRYFFSEERSGA